MMLTTTGTIPDHLAGYTWRPATAADAPAIWQMYADNVAADRLESAPAMDEIERIFAQMLADVHHDARTDSLLVLTPSGQVAACAFVFVFPSDTEQRAGLSGGVHTDHRRQGLGAHLLAWQEERATTKMAAANVGTVTGKRQFMQLNCRDHMQDRITLFQQRGFAAARYFFRMERDLTLAIPERPLIAELRITQWSSEMDEGMRQAFNESFRGHWGFFPVTTDIWRRWFTGKPEFRPDLTFLAVDDQDNVIGFCLSTVRPEANQQTGRQDGVMEDIGVIGGWRRRGIASALIAAAMRAYEAVGLAYAVLGVDTENPSGALRLYENLGFRAVRRNVTYLKEVDGVAYE